MTAVSGASTDPPQPPPLPPARNLLQRITAPFSLGIRSHGLHAGHSADASPRNVAHGRVHKQLPSQTTSHRTGIPIAALDINKDKTHAVLAGQEILKTVRIYEGRVVEDFNLRSAINSHASTYGPRSDAANHRREYLPAKDVRWSHGGRYETIIATAALNGRIALYDVSRLNSSRVELAWIHEHTGQVNKLDFDPFGGYLLISGSQDKTVKIWDIRDPKTVLKREGIHVRNPVRDVKWSPVDALEFALCAENGVIQKWDLRKAAQAKLNINAHEKACYTIDWHPDGKHVVSGGLDKYVRVWDFKSDNRKQKPAFQLRTPQAVMNLRWRPPCWTSDYRDGSQWQSTQLATGYDDDPRVHVWDLRRPLLPLRELDRWYSRPTDLVWASEDFLWTVGDGMFTQTDIRYASQVQDHLAPCALDFMPDGSFAGFAEDTTNGIDALLDDPTFFPAFARERLSGATDEGASRSLSDDDIDEELSMMASRRRQSRAASSRSAKSQGNTPPTSDGFPAVMPLHHSGIDRSELFDHGQVGSFSRVEGLAAEPYIVKFLAENYARPASAEERKSDPDQILDKLGKAFLQNAEACNLASLHRVAQSWRLLGSIVTAELRGWAEQNRKNRLEKEATKRHSTSHPVKHIGPTSPSATVANQIADSRTMNRPQKVINNLFKGVAASELLGVEPESTSNMTTPLAMPLPDSPHPREQHYVSLDEIMEPIPPLPPSVVNSHSVAAAASKALLGDPNRLEVGVESNSSENLRPSSSFRYRQHKRSATNLSVNSTGHVGQDRGLAPRPVLEGGSSPLIPTSPAVMARTHEDRRAALKDYRAQARPLFSLEAPVHSPRFERVSRNDSGDSFPMFSLSTESSTKDQALLESFESLEHEPRSRHDSTEWQHVQSRASFGSTPPSGEATRPLQGGKCLDRDFTNSKDSVDFAIDDAPGFSFGADGEATTKPGRVQQAGTSNDVWRTEETEVSQRQSQSATVASSASDTMFHFEQVPTVPKHKIYTSNPIRRMTSKQETTTIQSLKAQDLVVKDDDLDSREFVYSDFQPIDYTDYEPSLPFAWSALPLICHAIAFDVQEGIACGQFSVQLLLHIHPFFFNQAFRNALTSASSTTNALAERLMRPDYSHRIIEGLFVNHLQYLKKLHLYEAMAELRKICVEFDYPAVYNQAGLDEAVGSSIHKDPFGLQVSCNRCATTIPHGAAGCSQCRKARDVCPVCLSRDTSANMPQRNVTQLWTYCQICGHGGHMDCMQQWFVYTNSEGECPSPGCGCDCGPGLRRQQRMTRQAAEATNIEMIRGSRSGASVAKRDSLKAAHSPAVDKTRDALRHTDLRDRGTQSSDETGRRSTNGRGASRGTGNLSRSGSRLAKDALGGSNSRRVRLVTPGEQSIQASQSTS